MFFQCNMSMQVIVHRTQSDRVANAIGGKTKETTAPNKVLWFP